MGIEISDRFIDGDLAACRRVVAEVLQIIRRSPTGKIRHKSNPKRTIYAELIRLKLGRRVIVDEVAWDIMNAVRHIAYIDRLRTQRGEIQKASNQLNVDEIDRFLGNLLFHHEEIFHQLIDEGHESIQAIMKRRLETVMIPAVRFVQLSKGAHDRFNRELEADESHTNVRKTPLNRVTVQLCNLFDGTTQQPRYGLVGQLLCSMGLEENGGYSQISKRMQRRYEVWNDRYKLK